MLFVGAYRSDEVDEGHMLTSMINTLKDQNTTITQIGTPYNSLSLSLFLILCPTHRNHSIIDWGGLCSN